MADNTATAYRTDTTKEIDLGELFARLIPSWKIIFFFSLLGTVIAFLITQFLIVPKYKASSTLYVLSSKDSAINLSDLQIGAALTQDYIEVFDMWEVHEKVISNLDLPYTYKQISSMLTVTNATGTRMLEIAVTSPDPEEAAKIANEYAAVSSEYIAETMATEKPNIISAALVPTAPVSPNKVTNCAVGFFVGFLIPTVVLSMRIIMDDKIRTPEDITEYTGLNNLAIVPMEDFKNKKKTAGKSKKSGKKSKRSAREGAHTNV